MKHFDIEKAKKGMPVCTKKGSPVRIICYDREDNSAQHRCIVGLINTNGLELISSWNIDGKIDRYESSDLDLFMKTDIKVGWINIYPFNNANQKEYSIIYKTEKLAKDNRLETCIDTIKIEWGE